MKPASKSSSQLPELFVGQVPATQELSISLMIPRENHMFQEQWNCHTAEQGSGTEQIASLAAGPQCWSSLPGEIRGVKTSLRSQQSAQPASTRDFSQEQKKFKSISTNRKLQERRKDNPANVMHTALLPAQATLISKGQAEAVSRAFYTWLTFGQRIASLLKVTQAPDLQLQSFWVKFLNLEVE